MRDKIDVAKKMAIPLVVLFKLWLKICLLQSVVMQYDRKLDGRIAQGVVSINAFKGVSFGEGFKAENQVAKFKTKFYMIMKLIL